MEEGRGGAGRGEGEYSAFGYCEGKRECSVWKWVTHSYQREWADGLLDDSHPK